MSASITGAILLVLATLGHAQKVAAPAPGSSKCAPSAKTYPALFVPTGEPEDPFEGFYSVGMPLTGDQCGLFGCFQVGYYYQALTTGQNAHALGPQSIAYFCEYNAEFQAYIAYDNKTTTLIDDQWKTQAEDPIIELKDGKLTKLEMVLDMFDTVDLTNTFRKASDQLVANMELIGGKYKYSSYVRQKPAAEPAPPPQAYPEPQEFPVYAPPTPGVLFAKGSVPIGNNLFLTVAVTYGKAGLIQGSKPVQSQFSINNSDFPEAVKGLPAITNYTISEVLDSATSNVNQLIVEVMNPIGPEIVTLTMLVKGGLVTNSSNIAVSYPEIAMPPPDVMPPAMEPPVAEEGGGASTEMSPPVTEMSPPLMTPPTASGASSMLVGGALAFVALIVASL